MIVKLGLEMNLCTSKSVSLGPISVLWCPAGQGAAAPMSLLMLPCVPTGGGSRGRDESGADLETPDVSSYCEGQACDGRGLCAVFGISFWESLLFG